MTCNFKTRLLLAVIAVLASLPAAPGIARAARTQDRGEGVAEAGRQAVVYGQIISVRRDGLTIRAGGDKIKVDAKTLSGEGSLNDFYDKGMFVTVEGAMTKYDEIAASSITRNTYYPQTPPYIAGDAIISPEELR